MKWTSDSAIWTITLVVGLLTIVEGYVGVLFPEAWLPVIKMVGEVLALVSALLKGSLIGRSVWTPAQRSVEAVKRIAPVILLALALPLAMPGCGHGPDPKLNPVGAIAYNADQVAQLMGHVEKAIMAAEARQPKLLPTETARSILTTCRVLDAQNLVLADALQQLDKLPLGDFAQRTPLLTKISLALDVMNIAIFEVIKPIQDEALKEAVTGLVRQVARFLMMISAPGLNDTASDRMGETYRRLAA